MTCNYRVSVRWRQYRVRTPFQGDFVVRVVPRAEALGYSLFALRATANVQTPVTGGDARPTLTGYSEDSS